MKQGTGRSSARNAGVVTEGFSVFRSSVLSSLFVVFLAAAFVACGGSSGTKPVPVPTANPSATVGAGTTATTLSTSIASGYASTISLPATADGSSATISALLSTTLPAGFVTPASLQRSALSAGRAPAAVGVALAPIAYVVLTPTANVSFAGTPDFTFTVPPAIATSLANAAAYVAFNDPSLPTGWTNILGPGVVNGNSIAFTGAKGSLLLKGGRSYGFLLYSTAQSIPVTSPPAPSGAQLVLDLTQTNLPAGTPVYIYVIGTIKTTATDYWMQPSSLFQSAKRRPAALGATTVQPAQMIAMVPGKQIPAQANCQGNGDNTNYFSCNNNQLSGLPSPQASAINGGGGTGGNYPSAWADYSISATVGTKLSLPLSAISNLPGLGTGTSAFSGRIYISVGTPKLPITPTSASGYVAPVFGNGTGQPGEWTLFDWIEFSYDSNGVFNGNTTQVNQFGFPMQLSGNGGAVPAPQVLTASRNTILNYFAAQPAPVGGTGSSLGSVVVSVPTGAPNAYPSGVTYLRAIAPQTIVAVGAYSGPLTSTFDKTISTAYTAWQTTPLVTFEQSTQRYYYGIIFPTNSPSIPIPNGYTTGSLAFFGPETSGQYTTMSALAAAISGGQTPFAFSLIGTGVNPGPQNVVSSIDVWTNQNSLATGGPDEKNVGKMVAAGFNRGVIVSSTGVTTTLNDATCQTALPAYENSLYPTSGTFNWWAQYFHQNTATIAPNVTGLAYAFSYDDVCDQNPSVSFTPGTVTITLGNF